MRLRDHCYFCQQQLNDREEIVRNSVTGAVAHWACVRARPAERMCELSNAAMEADMTEQAQQQPEHISQFFVYAHLPSHLQEVSKPFGELAERIVTTLPRNPERTVALRKLLEAKDAAVRALLAK